MAAAIDASGCIVQNVDLTAETDQREFGRFVGRPRCSVVVGLLPSRIDGARAIWPVDFSGMRELPRRVGDVLDQERP